MTLFRWRNRAVSHSLETQYCNCLVDLGRELFFNELSLFLLLFKCCSWSWKRIWEEFQKTADINLSIDELIGYCFFFCSFGLILMLWFWGFVIRTTCWWTELELVGDWLNCLECSWFGRDRPSAAVEEQPLPRCIEQPGLPEPGPWLLLLHSVRNARD